MSENARNNGRIFNFPLSFPYQVCLRERPPLASSSASTADRKWRGGGGGGKGLLGTRGEGGKGGGKAALRLGGGMAPSLLCRRRPPAARRLPRPLATTTAAKANLPLQGGGIKEKTGWGGCHFLHRRVVPLSSPCRVQRGQTEKMNPPLPDDCAAVLGKLYSRAFFVALLWEEGNEGRTRDRFFFLLLLLRK